MQNSTTSNSAGNVTFFIIFVFLRMSRRQKKRTKCTVRYFGRRDIREVLVYIASRSRVGDLFSICSVRPFKIPSRRWDVSFSIWQSSFRKTSEVSVGASPASMAAGSSQVRVEANWPARYLSITEIASAPDGCCAEDELEGAGVAVILSFCRSCEMICVQASSASCCA